MKRSVLISLVIVCIFLAILGLFACGNDAVVEITPEEVEIALSEEGISFSYKDHTYFEYSTDGGAFFPLDGITTISFSDDAGEHTVVIKALDPSDTTKELATVSYSYRTVTTSLTTIRVSGMTASWTAVGKEILLKVGEGEFEPYAESSYTADDTVSISVKATNGFDVMNRVFYAGKTLTRNKTISASYNALSAPVIVAEGDRLSWETVTNATGYEISTDDSAYVVADRAEFSSVAGDHVFRVRALGDLENYTDSAPTEFRYTTVPTSLVVTKTAADAASFRYTGLDLARKVVSSASDTVLSDENDSAYMYKNGCLYYRIAGNNFTPWASGVVTFVATSGYDPYDAVYYSDETTEDVMFTLPALEAASFASSSFRAPTGVSAVETGVKYDGTPTAVFTYPQDGESYAYSAALRLTDGYDYLTLDVKGDALASVRLRFVDTANELSLSYDLGVLPAYWQSVGLSLAGEGWSIGDVAPTAFLTAMLEDPASFPERYRSLRSIAELVACFDSFEIVLSAASPDESGNVEFGGISLSYSEGAESTSVQPLYHRGDAYVLTEISDEEENDVFLRFDEEGFLLYSTALLENFYLTGECVYDEAAATLLLVNDDFSLTMLFTYNGYYLTADVGEGDAAEYLNGKSFRLAADLTLTFDGTADEVFVSDDWTSYYKSQSSGAFEVPTIPNMFLEAVPSAEDVGAGEEIPEDTQNEGLSDDTQNVEVSAGESDEEDGSDDELGSDQDEVVTEVSEGETALSLRAAYAQVNRFVYNEKGRSLGMANAFSMKVCATTPLQVRVVAVSVDGTPHYLFGTKDGYDEIPVTNGFVIMEKSLGEAIDLLSFYIEINNSDSRDTVSLLVSELSVSYQAEISQASQYPLPVITALADRLEFSYPIQNVMYEYALDASKDFTEGERGYYYPINGIVPGAHVLYVRALIGEEEASSKTEKYEFTVNAVTMSSVAVKIGDDGKHTATWSTNGECSLQVSEKVVTVDGEGNPVETEKILQEFTSVTEYLYVTDKDVTLTVMAQGYYDQENNEYYVGTVYVEKVILVSRRLDAPELAYTVKDGVEGIGWAPVENADRYSVQVNDAEAREQKECFFPFESGGSEYEIKVISIDEDGIAYSNASSFLYRVVPVSVSRLSRTDLTFSGKAVGARAYVSEKNKAESSLALGPTDGEGKRAFSYTVSGEGLHTVIVRVTAGFDDEAFILYVGEDVTAKDNVDISRIPKPVITTNAQKSDLITGLTWAKVFSDGETGYRVEESLNGGEWTVVSDGSSMVTEYFFKSEVGTYTIRVCAIGDGVEYLNSAWSEYSFTVRSVSLTPTDELVLTEEGRKLRLRVGSVALRTEIEEATTPDVHDDVRDYSVTTYVKLAAFGGYDMKNDIYYAGETKRWEKNLIVPIPLAAPVPESNGDGVYWSNVKNAEFYLVTLEKYNESTSSYEVIRDRVKVNVTLGSSESFFGFEAENDVYVLGLYRLTVLSSHSDLEQYPNDDATSVFTYEVRKVFVGEVEQQGNTLIWTYDAWSLAVYVDGERDESSNNRSTYTNKSGGSCIVQLFATEGYDAENHIRYIGEASSDPITVDYKQLLTPTLAPTETGLVWDGIVHANKYEVTVKKNGATLSVTDYDECAYAFPTEVGSYEVSVSAVDRIGSFKGSDPAVFIFEAKEVALSEIAERVTGKTSREAYWTKVGKTEISIEGGAYEPKDNTVYSPDETTSFSIKCSAGFVSSGENAGTYYFGEEQTQDFELIIPHFLEAPTLTLTKNGIAVSNVDPIAEKLLVSHDGGALNEADRSTTIIPNSVTAGSHTVTVTAYHSYEKQYPATDASVILSYTVKEVSVTLPDAAYVVDDLRFTANGIVTVSEAGELARTYAATDSYVYTPSATVTVIVTATSGLDAANACYYVGEKVTSSSMQVIIPIPLRAPTLKKEKDYVTVSTVDHADGYKLRYSKDGGNTWQEKPVTNGRFEYGDVDTENGSYLVEVRAYSEDPVQYPTVEASMASVSYNVASVTLSDLAKKDNVVSWTAKACEVSCKKTSSGQYTLTTNSSCTLTEAGEYSVYVRVRRGYKESDNTYYHLADETATKGPVSVSITKLSAPTVSGSSSGVTWSAVANATGYKVRVNSGSYETVNGTTKAFSTTQGTYKVEVIALGDDKTILSSDSGSYTYSVKTVTLSAITVSGRTASWTAVARKTYYKVDGGSYTQTASSSYALPASSGAGSHTVYVKAEGGFDEGNNVYYYCASSLEKSGKITLTKLAAPALSGGSKGVSWSKVSNASSYQSKTDSESYASNTSLSVSYSTSTGTHTVRVKAIASSSTAYVDSDEATFTYTTKQPSLSFVSQSNTEVAYTYVGVKAQYSTDNGSTWKDSSLPGYTATSSSTVKFRACGGYVSDAKVYYNGNSSAVSKSFTVSGQTIDLFENSSVSAWKKEKYTSSWATANDAALEIVPDSAGGGTALKLTSFANGSAYKITRSIGTMSTTYYALAFDIRVNRFYPTVKTTLQVQDKDSGIYITYDLSNLSAINSSNNWYHVVVSFNDSNLKINVGNKDYDPETIKGYISQTQYKTWDNAIKAMDDISFIVKGQDSSYAAIYTYIDNIRLLSSGSSSATKLTTGVSNLEFNDGTAWASYTNSSWKKYEWTDGAYKASSKDLLQCQLDRNEGAQNKVLSMYCGYNAYKFTYNEGGSALGKANHLSIDLASWSEGVSINYRIILIDGNNNEIFLAGSSSGYATLTPTAKPTMRALSFNFAETNIKSIVIIAQAGANANLFADNIYLSKSSVS